MPGRYDAQRARRAVDLDLRRGRQPCVALGHGGRHGRFRDSYSYDSDNRETQVIQAAQSTLPGHDYVEQKQVNFAYYADGQFSTIDRVAAGKADIHSAYTYDASGRLTELTHASGDRPLTPITIGPTTRTTR